MDRGFRSFGQGLGLVTLAALLLTETGHAARAETAQAEPPGEQSIHFDANARAGKKDLLATLHGEGNFETLIKAVNTAGMAPQLQGHGPLTLLAPAHYLATPGLWAGLVVGAAFIAGAIWLRRSREAI